MKKKMIKIVIGILILATAFISLNFILNSENVNKIAEIAGSQFIKAMASAQSKLDKVKSTYGDGKNLYISDNDMGTDPNLYCIEFGRPLGNNMDEKATYPYKGILGPYNATSEVGYLLSMEKDAARKSYMSSVQVAIWESKLNIGKPVQFFINDRSQWATEENYRGFIESAAKGRALKKEADAYANAQARYKEPTEKNTNATAKVSGDSFLIGPFKVNYSKEYFGGATVTVNGEGYSSTGSRPGKMFSGIVGAELLDQNGKAVTSKWTFTDKNGNALKNKAAGSDYQYPNPNQEFYIKMDYNENVTQITGLNFKFKQLEVKDGKYYKLTGGTYTNGGYIGEHSQELMIGSATQEYVDKSLNIKEDISLRITISGTVFKDMPNTKGNHEDAADGKYDSSREVPAKGVIVTLYDKDGNMVAMEQVKGEIRTNPTLSNDDGYYAFKGLNPTKSYYVKFTYDGQDYEPTKYDGTTDSKATDTKTERTTLTNRFAEIKAYPNNYTSTNSLGYGLSNNIAYSKYKYNTATDRQLTLGNIHCSSKEATENGIYTQITNAINSYIANNHKFPDLAKDIYPTIIANNSGDSEIRNKLQFIEDTKMNAYTGSNGKDNLVYYPSIGNKEIKDIDNVSFGIKERQEVDLAIRKNIYNAKLAINGKEHTYDYRSLAKLDFEVPIRVTSEKGAQTAPVYKSDYEFRIENYNNSSLNSNLEAIQATISKDQELRAFVTYQIVIRNQSSNLYGEITELVDYYDKDYTYSSSYIGDANGNKKQDISWSQGQKADVAYKTDKYNTMYTTGLAGQKIGTDDLYVYITYEVNKDSDGRILLDGDTDVKRNTVEINGYKSYNNNGELAGLIDIDSTPGNYNPNNIGTDTKYEDDTDQAAGLKFVLKGERSLNGYAWEDKTVLDKTSGAKIGNGIREKGEPTIAGVTVQLVEAKSGAEYVWQQTTTGDNGYYQFNGYIPGNYFVRFKYGDTESTVLTKANGGKNDTSYNGQDYKSTTYVEKGNTTWQIESTPLLSDARDDMTRRNSVNSYSQEMTNHKAQVLASYKAQQVNKELLNEMIANTYMLANTEGMSLGIEKADTEAQTIGDFKDYAIENVDLGLEKRPTAELKMTKDLAHIRVILEDGTVLFDTDKTQKDIAWQGPDRGNQVTVTMDENLMQGATVELTYKMTVTNVGETDYTGGTFYYTGKVGGNDKVVETKPTKVIDYIENNLHFNPEDPANSGWEVISKEALQTQNAQDTLVDKNVDVNSYAIIIQTKDTNPLVTKALKPGESTEVANLVLTKVMAADDESDSLTYANSAEIVRLTNTVGRKQETSIVGNQDPTKDPAEQDADSAELVRILPPYGGVNNIVYYGIAIVVAAIVLGVGIFFIKKKVITTGKEEKPKNKDEK